MTSMLVICKRFAMRLGLAAKVVALWRVLNLRSKPRLAVSLRCKMGWAGVDGLRARALSLICDVGRVSVGFSKTILMGRDSEVRYGLGVQSAAEWP